MITKVNKIIFLVDKRFSLAVDLRAMKKKDPRNIQIKLDAKKEEDREFEGNLLWYQGYLSNVEAVTLGRAPAVRKAADLFIRALKVKYAKGAAG